MTDDERSYEFVSFPHLVIPPRGQLGRVIAAQLVSAVAKPAYETGLDPSEFAHRVWGLDPDSGVECARQIISRAQALARETGGRVCWGGDCGVSKHWVLAQCVLEDDVAEHACGECGAYTPGPDAHPGGVCPECAAGAEEEE